MSQNATLPAEHTSFTPRARPNPTRLFYVAAAVIVLALTFIGFHHFYLYGKSYPGRDITPPIRTLIISHGIAMSGWLVLFLLQPLLVASGNRRVHMALGKLGAIYATAIFILGVCVAVQSARVSPPDMKLWGLLPKQFMAVPLIAVIIFALFVAVGVWQRKRPAIHRPMMLLATLSVLSAAVSRIDFINNLYVGTLWESLFGPFFATLILGALLLLAKCALTRSFDKWFTIGLGAQTLAFALTMQLATTPLWDHFASALVH